MLEKGGNLIVTGGEDKKLSPEEIAYFVENEAPPEHLKREAVDDPAYRKKVLFRRCAGSARVTIFEGGHDMLCDAALTWLANQKKAD